MATSREIIVTTLNESELLREDGLPENAVLQADTVDSVTVFPLVIIRWGAEIAGVGPVTRRPFELWSYDKGGDYSRCVRIGTHALQILGSLEPTKTDDGWLTQITVAGLGLGRGADMYDPGYKALVVPFRGVAVASGL